MVIIFAPREGIGKLKIFVLYVSVPKFQEVY